MLGILDQTTLRGERNSAAMHVLGWLGVALAVLAAAIPPGYVNSQHDKKQPRPPVGYVVEPTFRIAGPGGIEQAHVNTGSTSGEGNTPSDESEDESGTSDPGAAGARLRDLVSGPSAVDDLRDELRDVAEQLEDPLAAWTRRHHSHAADSGSDPDEN